MNIKTCTLFCMLFLCFKNHFSKQGYFFLSTFVIYTFWCYMFLLIILSRHIIMKCVAIILISFAMAAVMSNPMPDDEDNVCKPIIEPFVKEFCAGKDQVSISTTIFAQFCKENLSD